MRGSFFGSVRMFISSVIRYSWSGLIIAQIVQVTHLVWNDPLFIFWWKKLDARLIIKSR